MYHRQQLKNPFIIKILMNLSFIRRELKIINHSETLGEREGNEDED